MNDQDPNIKISSAVFKSLSNFWKDHECQDFRIVVDGESFYCPSYLLSSCSEFFKCLFRSDMRETLEKKVELKNISASIFGLVLKTLCNGTDELTQENVLDFWAAVHQLQIPFLIDHCEDFVMANLSFETLDGFKYQADYLQSEKVISFIFNYMLKNFAKVQKTHLFLNLSFEELTKLIKSDQLVVTCEDSVLLSIFDWVNHGDILEIGAENEEPMDDASNSNNASDSPPETTEEPSNEDANSTEISDSITENELFVSVPNEDRPNLRKKVLYELIQSTRYCLVSYACIGKLHQNKLALNNTWVQDILSQTYSIKHSSFMRGICPTSAIHRDCSNFEHVGITSYSNKLYAFSFKQRKFFPINNLVTSNDIKFAVFMGNLYACSSSQGSSSVYAFESNEFSSVYGPMLGLWSSVKLFIAHKNCIYLFSGNKIRCFDPANNAMLFETQAHCSEIPQYAMSFYEIILVFSPVKNSSGVEETAVHSWHTDTFLGTDVWTQLYYLPFSSTNMTSFCDDIHAYILDEDGNLWKLTDSDVIEFTFLAKLWSQKHPLRGAALFKDTLYIVPDVIPKDCVATVNGVFSSIYTILVFQLDKVSNLVHYVIDKKDLEIP